MNHKYGYTARLGPVSIAEDVPYPELVERVLEYAVRGAIAKAADQFDWEQEELRRGGLHTIEFLRDGKALWWDRKAYALEKTEAERAGAGSQFLDTNDVDCAFFERLDRDVCKKLRRAGYDMTGLTTSMKELYAHVGAEASDRAIQAREALISEIIGP